MLKEQGNTSPMDIDAVMVALNEEMAKDKAPPPEPVDPRTYLNKTILFGGSMGMNVSKGVLKKISKNGFILIEEKFVQNGQTLTTEQWHKPQDLYIFDELDE
jgi:hypothetical protein